jgi:hypothetical protein
MLVTSSITVVGSTLTGTKPSLVIVHTDSGYQPAGGHGGTGQIIAVLCY